MVESTEALRNWRELYNMRCSRPTRASCQGASKKRGKHSFFDPESYLERRQL
jgi:hypothetical protein